MPTLMSHAALLGATVSQAADKTNGTLGLVIALVVLIVAFLGRLWIARRQRRPPR